MSPILKYFWLRSFDPLKMTANSSTVMILLTPSQAFLMSTWERVWLASSSFTL